MTAQAMPEGLERVKLSLAPLRLYMEGTATEQEMNGNLEATLARGYVRVNEYEGKSSGAVSICGSAPSLKDTWPQLEGDVFAINSAIGYLLDQGVVPKWAMLWDAAEIVERFAVPHPEVTYLVGSRCHPKVFERLKGCKIVVWHAGGDHNIAELMEKYDIREPMINGGSAGITRALYVAYFLGYRDIHIHGADSSYSAHGETHIRGSLVPEKDLTISLGNNPPFWFRTTPEWCAQVNEYRSIYAMFVHPRAGAKLTMHGDGMLPLMHKFLDEKRKLLGEEKLLEEVVGQAKAQHDLDTGITQPLEDSHANACV